MNNIIDVQKNIVKFSTRILNSKKVFGFWLYLISDCIIFATLFSVYIVMATNIVDKVYRREIFNLPIVILESFSLLLSSFTYSFVILEIKKYKKNITIFWLFITSLLGLVFLMLEIFECNNLVGHGYSPSRNGFLSSFFTLLMVHGIHVFFAILYVIVMIVQVVKFGITYEVYMKIFCLSLFWHFLDIIWVFIFSVVYLIGEI
ncbi:MAG: cytochrome c oxidase subunit 3 [Buchnera aphidicola (Nurudea yanoniella)]